MWSYFLNGIDINGEKYLFEFDVISRNNGENHYRIQRLELDNKKQVNYDGDTLSALPPYSQPVSLNNNTTNEQKSQIALLSTNSNMQNNEKNDIKLPIKSNINDNIAEKDIKLPANKKKTNKETISKLVKDKINKVIQNQSYKAVNYATKSANNYLEFNNAEKKKFKEQLLSFKGKTKEQLTNAKTYNEIKEIVENYADKEVNYV